MKIQKYVKQKNGMYKVVLEDTTIKLHEDLILKYELLLKKEIDENLIKKLEKENLNYEIYNIAIKYINKRMRSKNELKNYLLKYEIDRNKIDEIIELLVNQGYLNDEVFINSFIHDKMLLTNMGPLKIKKLLQDEQIDLNLIEEKLSIYTDELEQERINKIITKNLKSNKKSNNAFKLKLKQDLLNLGYNIENIQTCLEHIKIDDEDNKKKEYEKLYKKYSKKYNGSELEYKIKQALYQKGYR